MLSACGPSNAEIQNTEKVLRSQEPTAQVSSAVSEGVPSPVVSEDVPSPEVVRPWIGDEKELREIPFQYVFRGFYLTSAEELSAIISGPDKSVIIQDEDGWHDYQSKYCPGIEWDAKFTFPDQYLFADIHMGAKPKYVGAYTGEKLMVGSEGLYIVEDYDYNEIPMSERIYAYSNLSEQNDAGAQYFLYIVAVNSSDIPDSVAENMRYKF